VPCGKRRPALLLVLSVDGELMLLPTKSRNVAALRLWQQELCQGRKARSQGHRDGGPRPGQRGDREDLGGRRGAPGGTCRGLTPCPFLRRPFPGVSVMPMLSPQRHHFAPTCRDASGGRDPSGGEKLPSGNRWWMEVGQRPLCFVWTVGNPSSC